MQVEGLPARSDRRSRRAVVPYAVQRFFRFAGTSLICTIFDQLLAGILFIVLREPMRELGFLRIFVASVVARIFSQALNFFLNHRLVFSGGPSEGRAEEGGLPTRCECLPRFLVVATFVLTLSTVIVYVLNRSLGLVESLGKLIADTLLFFVNYYLQHNWVFATEPTINPRKIRQRRQGQ